MTNEEIRGYLEGLIAMKGGSDPAGQLGTIIDVAVKLGRQAVWSDAPWKFKYRSTTLTCSTSAESYELPEDFDSMSTVKERESANGGEIDFYPKEQFDKEFSNPVTFTPGVPRAYTIHQPDEAKHWVISFCPYPVAGTIIYLHYAITPPTEADNFPDSLATTLVSSCERFVYPSSSAERLNAERVYRMNLEDARNLVGVNTQTISRVYHDDTVINKRPDWAIE